MKQLCRRIIGLATVLAVLLPGSSEAGVGCTVKFSVPETTTLGVLQFKVDYSGAAAEPIGTGSGVSCSSSVPGGVPAFNDDEGSETLHVGMIQLDGFATPTYVAQCSFAALMASSASEYAITVLDTRDPSGGTGGGNVCGAPSTGGSPPFARDAQLILQAAVGQPVSCQLCECDPNNSGAITASDCLLSLRAATLQPVVLDCGSACVGSPGGSAPTVSQTVEMSIVCNGVGCGNGTVEGDEECDDANPDNGDGCTTGCKIACPSTAADCRPAGLSKLLIKGDGTGDKDKLVWKWLKGPETLLSSISDGTTDGANYQLCIYPNGVQGELGLPDVWKAVGTKGYSTSSYLDNGTQKMSIFAGADGKAKVMLKASGTNLPDGLLPATSWTIALHDKGTGTCWSSMFTTPTVNDGTRIFKASTSAP